MSIVKVATANETPNTQFDIATAFFNIQAYALIKGNIQGVKRFRLLLGRTPEIRSEGTLGDVLLGMIKEQVERFDLSREKDRLVKEFCSCRLLKLYPFWSDP